MTKIKSFLLLVLLLGTLLHTAPAGAQVESRPLWLRYPMISPDGEWIAFTYKGDIYKVPSTGGQAIRLTTHEALESTPIWSPDGRQIAFVSDRNQEGINIYLMDATGGPARRITTHSGTETPYTFTPDGKYIIFEARIQDPYTSVLHPMSINTELYRVPVTGGRPEQILAWAAERVSLSKDGHKLLYQDVKGTENEWRKHHTSSVTRDIVEYDLKSGEMRYVIKHPGEDRDPVYSPDESTVYFLSERNGGSMNVYQIPATGQGEPSALTSFSGEPVRFLSISRSGKLCFGYGGEIYTLIPGGSPTRVPIAILNDMDASQVTSIRSSGGVTSATVSRDGKQIAYVVRGEVFVSSTDYSTTKRITDTPEEETGVTFSADGRTLVYQSDRGGKARLYKVELEKGEPNFSNSTIIREQRLIPGDDREMMAPTYSPDGKEIAFVLDRKKLAVYNIANGSIREITDGSTQHGMGGHITYEWSPDSKWFAISYVARNHAPYTDIGIVSAAGRQPIINITNSGYFDTNPHWAMDGNAILYQSEQYGMRNHASWGSQGDLMLAFVNREAYNKYRMSEEEYELFEAKEKKSEKADKESKKDKKKEKANEDKNDAEKSVSPIVVEPQNIEDRIVRLTPNSSDLGDAIMTKDGEKIYYLSAVEEGYDLWRHDLRKKETKLIKKLNTHRAWFEMSNDGKEIFILGRSPQKMTVSGETLKPISIHTEFQIDRAAEREYMYQVVRREERLRFYDSDMHGVDWAALTTHYERYLPHISNNADFAEMLSELLGELNVSHTGSGYRRPAPLNPTAELGLFYTSVPDTDGLRVDEVVAGGPFDTFLSRVQPGDIIEGIDGTPIRKGEDFFPLLNGKVGKNIAVSLYSPKSGQRWQEVIKGLSRGAWNDLLYLRWGKQRAAEVDRLSEGRLGYTHIPSMGDPSFRTTYADVLGKYYDRDGIVIDIRYNGGGRLHEDLEVFFNGKKYLEQVIDGKPYCEMPSRRWNHPVVMVTCEADYSNAHGTPWVFKHLGIAKIVGMPVPGTMTSVNWDTLQDPSLYFGIPAVGYRTKEGTYLENSQLEPDVLVPLDLKRAVSGHDSQIEAAVEVLLREAPRRGLVK